MNAPIQHTVVAAAGLDMLHHTRLKLACSLLMADRIDAQLRPWGSASVDLLVAAIDDGQGREALAEAQRVGLRTLTISRHDTGAGITRHGVTVRELSDHLRGLLATAAVARPGVRAMPLLDATRRVPGTVDLSRLQLGEHTVVIDAAQALLHTPSLALAELATLAAHANWRADTLSRAQYALEHGVRPMLSYPLESVLFAVAAKLDAPWLPLNPQEALQLRAWPQLDVELTPASWLIAIAQLLTRPWRAAALAQACDLPLTTVQGIFAASIDSGLAQRQAVAAAPPPRVRAAANTRFFSWVAQRFGLGISKGKA